MYRLMIVDDEQIVIDGLKFMVEEYEESWKVVATAMSGREAIEKAEETMPDLMLIDIQMPGINGIEAIEEIKTRYPTIKFVIISAYDQFRYAKVALELGVKEYILKPIHRQKLHEVLAKMKNELDKEKKQRHKEIANREKLEKIIPYLEHGFINSILFNTDYNQELKQYMDLFEVTREKGYIFMLEFGDQSNKDELRNKIGSSLKGQQEYTKIQSLIKSANKCIVGPMMINRILVLVFQEEALNEYEGRVRAINSCEKIVSGLEKILEASIHVGIGGTYSLERISNSLVEATYALAHIQDQKIVHYNDIQPGGNQEVSITALEIREHEEKLLKAFERDDTEELLDLTKAFLTKLDKRVQGNMDDLRQKVFELLVLIYRIGDLTLVLQDKDSSYLEELQKMKSSIEMMNWTLRQIKKLHYKMLQTKMNQVSSVVLQARDYIDQHYKEEIILQDVAEEVAISPQHLSKIFKEEVGYSFIEYITKKRIDLAKDLLKQGAYSVKEICYEIGYNDPNYFSRMFKKNIGVSPSEFNR